MLYYALVVTPLDTHTHTHAHSATDDQLRFDFGKRRIACGFLPPSSVVGPTADAISTENPSSQIGAATGLLCSGRSGGEDERVLKTKTVTHYSCSLVVGRVGRLGRAVDFNWFLIVECVWTCVCGLRSAPLSLTHKHTTRHTHSHRRTHIYALICYANTRTFYALL